MTTASRSVPRPKVHLVDGTYELFRHFFGQPRRRNDAGREVAAVSGVLRSMLSMLASGATHIGVATDHVIESFRNDMWPNYKSSQGVDPELLGQFGLFEDGLAAIGVKVWAAVELEADDYLASAATWGFGDPAIEQIVLCTPD
ncbi:MAG: flap endonuclease, partial [Acidimicrobiales bacterium]